MAPRTTRNRRPPNQEPTLLAAVTVTSESEAIDTVGALNANIDPALQTYKSDHPLPPTYEIDDPPSPSQFLNSLDPDYDNTYPLNDFQYPLPSPALPRSPEVSWPSTPRQPASPSPLPLVSNTQPGKSLRWIFEMEEILFQTLLEQVDNGKRAENGFKSDAWTACADAIIARTAYCQGVITTDKCKSKIEAMKAL